MFKEINTDPTPEPSKPKKARYKFILKCVFTVFAFAWRVYRAYAKAVEFLREFLD